MTKTLYEILDVEPQAPESSIREAYVTRMVHGRHHPDLGGSHGDAAQLNYAYQILRDPKQRAEYDDHIAETLSETPVSTTSSIAHDASPYRTKVDCAQCGATNRFRKTLPQLKRQTGIVCGLCKQDLHFTTPRVQRKQRHGVNKVAYIQRAGETTRHRAKVLDLSDHGLRLLSVSPLSVGDEVTIYGKDFEAHITISWVKKHAHLLMKHTYESGGAFIHFHPYKRQLILHQSV